MDSKTVNQLLLLLLVISSFAFGSWYSPFCVGFFVTALIILLSPIKIGSNFSLFWLSNAVLIIILIVFFILPLSKPLLINAAQELIWIEGHYTVTMISGFDLVCCSEVGTLVQADYGYGMSLLTALAFKTFSLLGVKDVSLVLVVKFYQLLAALMICALSYLLNKKAAPYIALLALGLTAYTLTNIGFAVAFPNQSGIRYSCPEKFCPLI